MVISHIALYVSDLKRSTAFYAGVLQLQPLEEPFKLGIHSWFSLGDRCQLHLIAGARQVPALHINHHLALRTDKFDNYLERLTENSIEYFTPDHQPNTVSVRPDGIRQVFFQDPDGYWLELNDEPLT
ncbi:Catechol 2,3-dioxygenase [Cnuella takakiae]|uniref:Catechol 2,3-dioxygenase n=1 Tax=Cnuella takakiae TaxID=1302690 RepID=A0A1M5GDV2_9BACT|nr:VOC family protein [Cnuella takakiae]OLY92382.1 hypothetical protein BUE76_11135 [Cnuella takakiae]SHG01876.1 Catechol 2,3-dioxygenase [Cnuella takakiae]